MQIEIPLAKLPDWPEDLEGIFKVEWPEEWPIDAGPPPRESRTPHTAAYNVLLKLDAWGVSEWGFEVYELIAEVFIPLWNEDVNPDERIDQVLDQCATSQDPSELIVDIVAAMCGKAFRAQSSGEIDLAWAYAVDAESWLGTLFVGTIGTDARRDARSKMAEKGAEAKHAQNRADKEKVFTWCDENMSRFGSMDDAALDIAETFVPQKFRTVRVWMTGWKKLRSAGTP